ncbi:MAG: hypothetical protein ACREEE_06405 [Dongiaceae bacterium]
MNAQSYIGQWGVWPEEDRGKRSVPIENVAAISDSPFRLPPEIANHLYRAGETGMGYYMFKLLFSDQTEQVCASGSAVDFVHLPVSKTAADIVNVIVGNGRKAGYVKGPAYSWCLFGDGELKI